MLTTLAIITTTRCDLKCQHCLRGFPKERPDFPMELLDKLLTEAMPFGARHGALTGGEPHLHPQFEEMVEKIISYGYTWSFVSHGQRTEPYLPLMEKYPEKLKHLSLSIDGARAETHDDLRGKKGAFEKVIASARAYIEKGFDVRAGMTLNQINQGEIKDFIKLVENLGIRKIRFGGTIPTPWNQHLLFSDEEAVKLHQKILELRKKTQVNINVTTSLYSRGGVNFCGAFNLSEFTFNSNGKLILCCDTIESGFGIGSLKKFSLNELIQMWLAESARLQSHRTEKIASGIISEGFDTCGFCNQYLTSASIRKGSSI